MRTERQPWVINEWYGRTGNNIQQISNALYFCLTQTPPLDFHMPDHGLIELFSDKPKGGIEPKISSRFFFYKEESDILPDFDCDPEHLDSVRKFICETRIYKRLLKSYGDIEPLPSSTLVIHLRGGDVFQSNPPNSYVQNPLSFYKKLIKNFKSTIVVAEDLENPVANYFKNDPTVDFQSSSEKEDFHTLLRAKNMASSGVGTFAMAAALCSPHLENFFCTDLFQDAHLNPTMLEKDYRKKVNVQMTPLLNYIKMGEWQNTDSQRTLMLEYQC